jgi:bifunctional UDP-N-acetylglucosamine pyrophosphorylase/glucosamine-1-phosphate N-acetyltransferase/UDP-N-acetylglucosamine pyrophosphorylase
MKNNTAVIILAAGLGTRMKSDKAKVLHTVCGKPMITYVLGTARNISVDEIIVVVGHQAEQVKAACRAGGNVKFALQGQQLGTGHAVLCALPGLSRDIENVLILCGDVPLLRAPMIDDLLTDHIQENRTLSLLAVETDTPTGYGRIKIDNRRNLAKIVEEKDASQEEKRIKLINAGIYCVNKQFLQTSLKKITPDNAQKEFYLTDIIEIGYLTQENMGVLVSGNKEDVLGINTVQDLKAVEAILDKRREQKKRSKAIS